MTLDLDDLERKARAAQLHPGKPVDSSQVAALHDALLPSVVLALIERVRTAEQRQARAPVTVGMYTPSGFEPYPGHDVCGMDFDTWAEATRKRIAENA